jgi:hypothetical protein
MHASECDDGLQVLGQYYGAWASVHVSHTHTHRMPYKLARGSRILRWFQSHRMGSEGPAFSWARIGFVWGGHSEQLSWGTRQPRRWYQWTAAVPAEGI